MTGPINPRLSPALTAVRAHPEHPRSIAELARIAAVCARGAVHPLTGVFRRPRTSPRGDSTGPRSC